MAGCSGVEIAAQIGVHENTLYQRCKSDLGVDFVAFKQEKQAAGESLLRKVQFDTAVKDKDRTMLVWLGKQRLGQKEKMAKAGILLWTPTNLKMTTTGKDKNYLPTEQGAGMTAKGREAYNRKNNANLANADIQTRLQTADIVNSVVIQYDDPVLYMLLPLVGSGQRAPEHQARQISQPRSRGGL